MATKRLYRSRHGEMLGVCAGIAEWRDYPVDTIRLIFILVSVFTAIAPCLIAYLILGLILPVNPYEEDSGYRGGRRKSGKTYYYTPQPEDFVKDTDYKESSEDFERRRKESDWDNRFSNS
ncbi:MAG: PspC domain-containing protein [Sphaerochaeta sp.]